MHRGPYDARETCRQTCLPTAPRKTRRRDITHHQGQPGRAPIHLKISRKWTLLSIAGLVLVALAAYLLLWSGGDTPTLVTATVARGDLESTVVATGTVEPKELVGVGAQVSGRLESLNVALGETVRKGQLIAQIDPRTQTNALRTATADLANLKAQRASKQATQAQAELAFARQQTMVAGEATSRADFEAAQATLRSARAEVAALDAQISSAEAALDTARLNLGYTRISAPMDGVVVRIVTKQGQTVNANQSAPTIIVLAKLDVMEIRAEVSEADVIRVKPGQPVYFTILGDPDHRYNATLRQIEPAPESIVDEVTSSSTTSSSSSSSSSSSTAIYYNALFDIPNRDGRLRALMTAQVSIVLGRASNTLLIPSTALGDRDSNGRYAVQVLGTDGQAVTRKVRIGMNNNVRAQVLSGLKEGERVVTGTAPTTETTTSRRSGPPPMM